MRVVVTFGLTRRVKLVIKWGEFALACTAPARSLVVPRTGSGSGSLVFVRYGAGATKPVDNSL